MGLEFFRQIFEGKKHTSIRLMTIRSAFHAAGRTDRAKLLVAFLQFCKPA